MAFHDIAPLIALVTATALSPLRGDIQNNRNIHNGLVGQCFICFACFWNCRMVRGDIDAIGPLNPP